MREDRESDRRMTEIVEMFKEHTRSDEKGFEAIHATLTKIKDNHLAHIEKATTKQATDIEWFKKFFWLIASTSVGSLIAALMNLI